MPAAAGKPAAQGPQSLAAACVPAQAQSLAYQVSVITPARNAAGFVARAVQSVADQTIPVHEHIVVDDGSDDGTAHVVQALQREYPHLVYLHQERRGSGAARNAGIKYATGRYIAFLDSDDWWHPQKLAMQLSFMQQTGAEITYGAYEKRCGKTGRTLARYDPPDSLGYEDLLAGCPIGCLTAAYDQQVLGKRYMPNVARGQDWGLWLALTREGARAQRYPGEHAVYHRRDGTLSSNKVVKAWDIYRIYRQEESFGRLDASRYLYRHILSAIRKP